jgi:hypothetical protein
MSRLELVRKLAEFTTRPIAGPMHQPIGDPLAEAQPPLAIRHGTDLFVWFEDTSNRYRGTRRGIAGLPESLLPYADDLRIVDRRYVEGHLHLLSAVRLRCRGGKDSVGERIASLYTAALSVGTIAWIGTGSQYEQAWNEMFPYSANDPATPDFPSEI